MIVVILYLIPLLCLSIGLISISFNLLELRALRARYLNLRLAERSHDHSITLNQIMKAISPFYGLFISMDKQFEVPVAGNLFLLAFYMLLLWTSSIALNSNEFKIENCLIVGFSVTVTTTFLSFVFMIKFVSSFNTQVIPKKTLFSFECFLVFVLLLFAWMGVLDLLYLNYLDDESDVILYHILISVSFDLPVRFAVALILRYFKLFPSYTKNYKAFYPDLILANEESRSNEDVSLIYPESKSLESCLKDITVFMNPLNSSPDINNNYSRRQTQLQRPLYQCNFKCSPKALSNISDDSYCPSFAEFAYQTDNFYEYVLSEDRNPVSCNEYENDNEIKRVEKDKEIKLVEKDKEIKLVEKDKEIKLVETDKEIKLVEKDKEIKLFVKDNELKLVEGDCQEDLENSYSIHENMLAHSIKFHNRKYEKKIIKRQNSSENIRLYESWGGIRRSKTELKVFDNEKLPNIQYCEEIEFLKTGKEGKDNYIKDHRQICVYNERDEIHKTLDNQQHRDAELSFEPEETHIEHPDIFIPSGSKEIKEYNSTSLLLPDQEMKYAGHVESRKAAEIQINCSNEEINQEFVTGLEHKSRKTKELVITDKIDQSQISEIGFEFSGRTFLQKTDKDAIENKEYVVIKKMQDIESYEELPIEIQNKEIESKDNSVYCPENKMNTIELEYPIEEIENKNTPAYFTQLKINQNELEYPEKEFESKDIPGYFPETKLNQIELKHSKGKFRNEDASVYCPESKMNQIELEYPIEKTGNKDASVYCLESKMNTFEPESSMEQTGNKNSLEYCKETKINQNELEYPGKGFEIKDASACFSETKFNQIELKYPVEEFKHKDDSIYCSESKMNQTELEYPLQKIGNKDASAHSPETKIDRNDLEYPIEEFRNKDNSIYCPESKLNHIEMEYPVQDLRFAKNEASSTLDQRKEMKPNLDFKISDEEIFNSDIMPYTERIKQNSGLDIHEISPCHQLPNPPDSYDKKNRKLSVKLPIESKNKKSFKIAQEILSQSKKYARPSTSRRVESTEQSKRTKSSSRKIKPGNPYLMYTNQIYPMHTDRGKKDDLDLDDRKFIKNQNKKSSFIAAVYREYKKR